MFATVVKPRALSLFSYDANKLTIKNNLKRSNPTMMKRAWKQMTDGKKHCLPPQISVSWCSWDLVLTHVRVYCRLLSQQRKGSPFCPCGDSGTQASSILRICCLLRLEKVHSSLKSRGTCYFCIHNLFVMTNHSATLRCKLLCRLLCKLLCKLRCRYRCWLGNLFP